MAVYFMTEEQYKLVDSLLVSIRMGFYPSDEDTWGIGSFGKMADDGKITAPDSFGHYRSFSNEK